MSTFIEARHDAIVSIEVITFVAGLEWLHQDGVSDFKVNHNVVVSAALDNWEVFHVVCVELSGRLHLD